MDLVRTGAGEFLGPGTLLHAAVAAAEFGADVRGQEGDEEADFAEEGLEDGEAAAGDGEVDFDGPMFTESEPLWNARTKNKDLHPDLVCDQAPDVIGTTTRLVQLILSYDGDSTDPVLGQRTGFRCDGKMGSTHTAPLAKTTETPIFFALSICSVQSSGIGMTRSIKSTKMLQKPNTISTLGAEIGHTVVGSMRTL